MTLTFTEDVLGTPHYTAPEQMRGSKAVDARADVYAAGAVLLELVSGAPPPNQVTTEWKPGGLQGDLAEVIGKAREYEPDRRYASAGLLREDLERIRVRL